MVIIAHRGSPCDPPLVDGVMFASHPEDAGLFLGEATEEQAANLTRIPAFTRFGGDTSKLGFLETPPDARVPPVSVKPDKPIIQWKNADLLAAVVAGWDKEAVQAKAAELGLTKPEDADRNGLIALASAAAKE